MMDDSFFPLQVGFNILYKFVDKLKSQRSKVRVIPLVEVLVVHIDNLGGRGLRRLNPRATEI